MKRRTFLKSVLASAACLAAQGHLPLLAAGKQKRANPVWGTPNCFTEPAAIEPVTGYLPNFVPVSSGGMTTPFTARYELVQFYASDQKSRNKVSGMIDVTYSESLCDTLEHRGDSIVKASTCVAGKHNAVAEWSLESRIEGRDDLTFLENGTYDGKIMTVESKSWKQQHKTNCPLVARWALLPLLASGGLKSQALEFDMLDDSTLRPNQRLRYEGAIEVPVQSGIATLDSYVQTGWGIVPTHYLVDQDGRVQLITMTTVNWALKRLSS